MNDLSFIGKSRCERLRLYQLRGTDSRNREALRESTARSHAPLLSGMATGREWLVAGKVRNARVREGAAHARTPSTVRNDPQTRSR